MHFYKRKARSILGPSQPHSIYFTGLTNLPLAVKWPLATRSRCISCRFWPLSLTVWYWYTPVAPISDRQFPQQLFSCLVRTSEIWAQLLPQSLTSESLRQTSCLLVCYLRNWCCGCSGTAGVVAGIATVKGTWLDSWTASIKCITNNAPFIAAVASNIFWIESFNRVGFITVVLRNKTQSTTSVFPQKQLLQVQACSLSKCIVTPFKIPR